MKKTILILICIFLLTAFSVYFGIIIFSNTEEKNEKVYGNIIKQENKIQISTLEVSGIEEEKTTPNTLIIYRTYYTKCKHYVHEYKDIDASFVNLTENELEEKLNNKWHIQKFSNEEIVLAREIEEYCNEHYKIKLENSVIVIYNIDENGLETEYKHTGITTEYLTNEDILKLTSGIYVYGKENLTSTIEDYE